MEAMEDSNKHTCYGYNRMCMLCLTLMRTRCRETDLVWPQKQISSVQIETGSLSEIGSVDRARGIRLYGHVIEQKLVFGLGNFNPTSPSAVSGSSKRGGECTSIGPALTRPSLP